MLISQGRFKGLTAAAMQQDANSEPKDETVHESNLQTYIGGQRSILM